MIWDWERTATPAYNIVCDHCRRYEWHFGCQLTQTPKPLLSFFLLSLPICLYLPLYRGILFSITASNHSSMRHTVLCWLLRTSDSSYSVTPFLHAAGSCAMNSSFNLAIVSPVPNPLSEAVRIRHDTVKHLAYLTCICDIVVIGDVWWAKSLLFKYLHQRFAANFSVERFFFFLFWSFLSIQVEVVFFFYLLTGYSQPFL